jgi:hypothetical protein
MVLSNFLAAVSSQNETDDLRVGSTYDGHSNWFKVQLYGLSFLLVITSHAETDPLRCEQQQRLPL